MKTYKLKEGAEVRIETPKTKVQLRGQLRAVIS